MPKTKNKKGRNKSVKSERTTEKSKKSKMPKPPTLFQRLSSLDFFRSAEDFNIVLITTHGRYDSFDEESTSTSTLHFNKINAVIPGVCNFLDQDDGIEFRALIDVLRSKKLSYDDFVQELQSTLPAIDPWLQNYNSRINLKQIAEDHTMNVKDYNDMRRHMVSSNRSYQTFEVLKGDNYIDKIFKVPDCKSVSCDHVFNGIFLFKNSNAKSLPEDIFLKVYEHAVLKHNDPRKYNVFMKAPSKSVWMSQVIEYLVDTGLDKKTIFIDLSCGSSEKDDPRTLRRITRKQDIARGGLRKTRKKLF
jgi:hypothetical protein